MAKIRVPACPRCRSPVKEAPLTPGLAFCGQCRGGPWSMATLPSVSVEVEDEEEEVE